MSIIDKVVSAVTPLESDEARREARSGARSTARSGDWLYMVLQHHEQIEAAFAAVKAASTATAQTAALKKLGVVLTGHSNAEESVIYPAMTKADEKGHAGTAYTEQAAAKTQMALLEGLTPLSQEFLDKLEHIRGAVSHHMYEEEKHWFLELHQKAPPADQAKITERYQEEFSQYVGRDAEHPQELRRASGEY
jgi:hypothetical protein